ncbi:MAG: metal ABC transporter permease [Candidatus Eremiobacteraeota bacterium]|nr:metal ABC transporter permease [Candidatus Eremiobacteraeota bacterium]
MLDTLLSPFHLDFMVRGFIAALIVGVLCSTMGTFVILRKLSFIGDGIAHASFAGIVIAYMKGANYYAGAAIVAVITALGIGFVHRKGNISLDTTIGVLFTGAFALGVFLMSRLHTYTVDLQDFLFGNILGVSHQDLVFIAVLATIVMVTLGASYRALIYTSFDPVVAKSSGIPADFIDYLLLVMLALTIVVTLEAVGIVLVAALLVTPAAAAYQLTNRLSRMMVLSAVLGAVCSVGGLYLSYYLNAASGATIVLMATFVFFIAIGVRRLHAAFAVSEA